MKHRPNDTKTLLLWPPGPVLYDNLCYHYCAFGEVAGYLQSRTHLKVIDAGVASLSPSELARRILEFKPDFVILYHDFDNLPLIPPTVDLVRAAVDTRILTYGPPGVHCSGPFLEKGIDGVVFDGDWEFALASAILEPDRPMGIVTRYSRYPGKRIPPAEWGFPLLEKLPLEKYKDWNRAGRPCTERAGLAGLSELSVTLSRGCGRRCAFCKTPMVEGIKDRRRDIAHAMDFIVKTFQRYGFDYFSVYSPNFTLDRDYAIAFAQEMKRWSLSWKCVTSLEFLDPDLIRKMAEGGCRRIGIGVETMTPRALETLSIRKRTDSLDEVATACHNNDVDLHCFLMLGIPGEDRTSFVETVRRLIRWRASVRVTSYVPYQEITERSTWDHLVRMNRRTYRCSLPEGMRREEFAQILFNQDEWIQRIV